LGATLSRKFDYTLIEAVSPWDATTLQNGLGQLVEAGLLFQQGTLPLASYEFKHALIQDAAYQSLLKGRRQQYHRRIAKVLEGISSVDIPTRSELLAHHYSEAGLFEEAIAYWQIAGQRDLEQAANQEAIAHFTRGLELLKKLPESSERDHQELEMQLGLAPAYMAIKGWAAKEVEQASIRARHLSIQLGNSQSLYASLWGLWANYFIRGQMEEALKTANETLQKALSINDPLMYISGHHAVGYTRFYRGEYRLSRDLAQEGLSKFDLANERILTQAFQLSSTACLQIILAGSWWMMGNLRLASQHIDEALTLAETLNHLPTHAYVLAASCYHYQPARNIQWVEEKSAQVIQICREENFSLWLAVGMMYHGWAIAAKGLVEEGLLEAEEGLALFRKTGTSIILPHFMTMLGEMYWLSGRKEEALRSLDDGMREAVRRSEHHMEPELYRLKAEILLEKANASSPIEKQISLVGEAEVCLNCAMTLAQEQEASMLELRAALSLSRHWISCCKQREAYQLLLRVYSQFSEVQPAPEFEESRILLEQLEDVIEMD
jgi:tetratricopeptide (TPR) repeat protein